MHEIEPKQRKSKIYSQSITKLASTTSDDGEVNPLSIGRGVMKDEATSPGDTVVLSKIFLIAGLMFSHPKSIYLAMLLKYLFLMLGGPDEV